MWHKQAKNHSGGYASGNSKGCGFNKVETLEWGHGEYGGTKGVENRSWEAKYRDWEAKCKELKMKNDKLTKQETDQLQVQGAKHMIWDAIIEEKNKFRPYLD